jgi:DNA-binding SARP family transcriptional activator
VTENVVKPSAVVRFHIFGTVRITLDGRPVDAGTRQLRCLLAVLLLADGWIRRNRLIDCLWDNPSDTARDDLFKLIGKLRKLLTDVGLDGALEVKDGLYRLRTPPGSVDVQQFRDLVRQAGQAEEKPAAELLEEAMRIASDEPLADLTGFGVDAQRYALAEECRTARLELEKVSLQLGRHQARIPHLMADFREDPADEAIAGLLMVALYGAGRQKDAVEIFLEVKRHLVETGGLDVSPDLADLYQRIISNDPELNSSDPSEEPPPRRRAKQPKTGETIHNEFHGPVDVSGPGGTIGISYHHYGTRGG